MLQHAATQKGRETHMRSLSEWKNAQQAPLRLILERGCFVALAIQALPCVVLRTVSNFLLAADTLSLAVQAADLKGGKAKAGEAAAGLDGMTSDVAAATRDAGGEVVDAAPVDNDKCVALHSTTCTTQASSMQLQVAVSRLPFCV